MKQNDKPYAKEEIDEASKENRGVVDYEYNFRTLPIRLVNFYQLYWILDIISNYDNLY